MANMQKQCIYLINQLGLPVFIKTSLVSKIKQIKEPELASDAPDYAKVAAANQVLYQVMALVNQTALNRHDQELVCGYLSTLTVPVSRAAVTRTRLQLIVN